VPHMGWTLTPTFVLVLAALAEVSWAETAVISLAIGVVQSLWRPAQRPMLSQVLFGPASLTLSAALAYGMSRVVLAPWLGHNRGRRAGGLDAGAVRIQHADSGHGAGAGEPQAAERGLATLLLLVAALLLGGGGSGGCHGGHRPDGAMGSLAAGSAADGAGVCLLL